MFYALFLELSPEQTNLTLKITREGRLLTETNYLIGIFKQSFSRHTGTPSHSIAIETFPGERIKINQIYDLFLTYLLEPEKYDSHILQVYFLVFVSSEFINLLKYYPIIIQPHTRSWSEESGGDTAHL